jgi:hypothetical protein
MLTARFPVLPENWLNLLTATSVTKRGARKSGAFYARSYRGNGKLLVSPYLLLFDGNYEVQIDAATEGSVDGIAMSVDVRRGLFKIVGPQFTTSSALDKGGAVRVAFSVSADDAGPFKIRIASVGRGRLAVSAVRIFRSTEDVVIKPNSIWRLTVVIRRMARRLPWWRLEAFTRRLVRRQRRIIYYARRLAKGHLDLN